MNKENVKDLIDNIICEWEQGYKGNWFVIEFLKDLKLIRKGVMKK